ncbi:MAG: hypothetical protein HGN29_13355 [Asgard group archaeon]|nr:hypothetical protein [Asgard group archaeon]
MVNDFRMVSSLANIHKLDMDYTINLATMNNANFEIISRIIPKRAEKIYVLPLFFMPRRERRGLHIDKFNKLNIFIGNNQPCIPLDNNTNERIAVKYIVYSLLNECKTNNNEKGFSEILNKFVGTKKKFGINSNIQSIINSNFDGSFFTEESYSSWYEKPYGTDFRLYYRYYEEFYLGRLSSELTSVFDEIQLDNSWGVFLANFLEYRLQFVYIPDEYNEEDIYALRTTYNQNLDYSRKTFRKFENYLQLPPFPIMPFQDIHEDNLQIRVDPPEGVKFHFQGEEIVRKREKKEDRDPYAGLKIDESKHKTYSVTHKRRGDSEKHSKRNITTSKKSNDWSTSHYEFIIFHHPEIQRDKEIIMRPNALLRYKAKFSPLLITYTIILLISTFGIALEIYNLVKDNRISVEVDFTLVLFIIGASIGLIQDYNNKKSIQQFILAPIFYLQIFIVIILFIVIIITNFLK